jgi:acyl transferase domain-containing protein
MILPANGIAIIGIGCRFPGGVSDAASFWRLLMTGGDAITEIPQDRIDIGHYYDPVPATAGRMMTRWGGFLDGIDQFDAEFFGISPREAERLDPQQRLLLETAWEALEDAGQDLRQLDASRCGVFVGQWIGDFESRLFADPEAVDFQMTTGSGRYAASGRLSYALDFRGPSLTVDSACSSSLAAVHLAVRSIRSGESKLALAAGVNVILQPHITIAYSQSRMMAPDGRCKFGDAGGDGYVRSEGAGVVVLKALPDAIADGDRIYAVIRGSAVNNDGRSSGSMGTPSRQGQEELLRVAYADAGISAGQVGYIEAHGTGTRAGDPVEFGALAAVLSEGRTAGTSAFVGSVKTNIGHAEGAAGMAGLIKAALTLNHEAIPASLHCRVPNPVIPWSEIPCRLPDATLPWLDRGAPRIAGVSGFGIAGTNGHVVLQSAPPLVESRAADQCGVTLLPLSARSPEALRALAERYAEMMSSDAAPPLAELCWNAATRRTPLAHRAVFVAGSASELADQLRQFAAGSPAAAEGAVRDAVPPRIAFVLPGQGAQWIGMGRQLLVQQPEFRAPLERCDAAARPFMTCSIIEQLGAEPGSPSFALDRIDVIQPVLVALAVAYAELLRSFGIVPDAVVGHSMGEVAAACIAGILELDQAMQIICRRSALMRRVSGHGAMALVDLGIDALWPHLAGLEDRVAIAASNGPRASVISGAPDAVRDVMARLEKEAVFTRLVKVDVASHSPQMEPLAAELRGELTALRPSEAQVPVYSTVLGGAVEGAVMDAEYWARNLREPVLFSTAVGCMVQDGITAFLELSPHPVLLPSVQQIAPGVATVACGWREQPEAKSILSALGALWVSGYGLDWKRILSPRPFRRLPLYPWQRERHWAEAAELRPGNAGSARRISRPDEATRRWLYRLAWVRAERAIEPPRQKGGWLVLADDGEERAEITTAFASAGATVEALPVSALSDRLRSGLPPSGIVVLADDSSDSTYLPLRVLQASLVSDAPAPPRLWFVTRGAQAVAAPSRVSVNQAALWGAARVVGEEHPDRWGGLIDFTANEKIAAASLAQEVLCPDGADQIAYRGGWRHVLRLVPDEADKTVAAAWREDSSYLITGGLGAIGRQVARALATAGVRRIILMNRTALPPRGQWSATPADTEVGQRIAAVRALEATGVAVHTPAVDITDEAELRAFLDTYAAEGWPPVRGVFHTAVALDNRLAGAMDQATFEGALRAKLRAAQLLDSLLPELDLFVLFSSIGAFLPHAGVANYAAANAGLDALAQDRQARGQRALSIAWGPWKNAGLALGASGVHAVEAMAQQGIQVIPPETGGSLLTWLCGQPGAYCAVMPADWGHFRKARSTRSSCLYEQLLGSSVDDQSGDLDGLASVDPVERRKILERLTRQAVGQVLKLAPDRIDARKTLGDMGLTSLLAIELRNRLESVLQRPLSATLAWNHPTIEAMVLYLAAEPADEPCSDAPAILPLEALPDIAAMSDGDVLEALRRHPADAAE